MNSFARTGWSLFDIPSADAWRAAALTAAQNIAREPRERAAWLRHGQTWFAGVGSLPNDTAGALPGGPPLPREIVARAAELHGSEPEWDRGQISIVYPGYPAQDANESDAAHRFRLRRDAAHVDGLLPVGPERRRKMQEPHGFVLGIPLTHCDAGASPMVIWEGSHDIIRAAFRAALHGIPVAAWSEHDLTDVYQDARRRCFEACRRVPVIAEPGQAYLIHRLALHGVAPWREGARAPRDGRIILYFRPGFAGGPSGQTWLDAP